jgi:hypothetical protein
VVYSDIHYTLEHLVLLLQIIDTNAAHIDEIISKKHDFGYLNGYLHASSVENLNKYYVDYCEEIKVRQSIGQNLKNENNKE